MALREWARPGPGAGGGRSKRARRVAVRGRGGIALVEEGLRGGRVVLLPGPPSEEHDGDGEEHDAEVLGG